MAALRAVDIVKRFGSEAARLTEGNLRKAFVGGVWRDALSKKTFPVYNPATWEVIAEVPDMNKDDVLEAISEAYTAQKNWCSRTAKERASILKNCHTRLLDVKDHLAELITLEQGKPLVEAQAEVAYGLSFIEWFAEEGRRVYGDIIPAPVRGQRTLVIKQPVGVATLIVPWNFPCAMLLRKASAALAAGCSIVAKPSEETPLSAMVIAEVFAQGGIPQGLFNLVTCSRSQVSEFSDTICTSSKISKVSFTGSTVVGRLLMANCANSIKRLSLELGGNAPLIVFNSADVESAVKGTIAAKFRNTGQTCIAANRILVQDSIFDEYVEQLTKEVKELKLGMGFDTGVNQGPLITPKAIEKVTNLVSDATSKGAKVITGGSIDEQLGTCFYRPSVITNMNPDMDMTHEEIFGPVAAITKFHDEDIAIELANNTPYGLAAYFFTNDLKQSWRVAEQLESGILGINEGAVSAASVPFGGIKQSGLGREGSKYGINEYVDIKYLCIGGL